MILVTGATGHLGQHVVRALRAIGLPTRALVRKGSEYYWLNDTGCRYFFGDLRDPDGLRRACRDVTHLVVASGVSLETRDNHHANVTVEGHRALFRVARERGVGRAVLLSCIGVDRDLGVPSLDARRAAEEALVASGLDYAILRAPPHERFFLQGALAVVDRGRAWLPGPGTAPLAPLPARDLARMAAAALDHEALRNQVIEVIGAETMTARAAFEAACRALGVEPRARVLPAPVVALARRLQRPVRRYAHRLAEHHAWYTQRMDQGWRPADFGLEATPWSDALAETGEWMMAMRDPEERARRMEHPKLQATVYTPGVSNLRDLPAGPPPRRD